MAQKKCLFKKENSDYEEEDFFTSKCFQVRPHVQFKEVPTNGEEYLLKVIREREKYASVLQCDYIDYKKLSKKVSKKGKSYFEEIANPAAPETIKPTAEWQNIQVADFSDIRKYIQQMQVKDLVPPTIKDICDRKRRVECWKSLFNEEPTMTHVVGISQFMIDAGLDILTEQLGLVEAGQTVDRKTGQWIYTLLAVTRYPHLYDTTTKLRDLARKCLEIRSRINPEDENAKELAAPMNLFICLVARYFGQKDLAD
ncbi:unnamed protein product [Arctia plantaginis]|uniref:Gem-associated protein 2 n=1 Tax=Arctia plantaginis TaxID=874455 RepID=A0A8S1A6S1_ARCPL|nr:unnamed protein product [Arctia plantaginis]CAB3256450.1 unnamed protein product [Arctia plantaginis]